MCGFNSNVLNMHSKQKEIVLVTNRAVSSTYPPPIQQTNMPYESSFPFTDRKPTPENPHIHMHGWLTSVIKQ